MALQEKGVKAIFKGVKTKATGPIPVAGGSFIEKRQNPPAQPVKKGKNGKKAKLIVKPPHVREIPERKAGVTYRLPADLRFNNPDGIAKVVKHEDGSEPEPPTPGDRIPGLVPHTSPARAKSDHQYRTIAPEPTDNAEQVTAAPETTENAETQPPAPDVQKTVKVPDKLKGKSLEEMTEAYVNLESLTGRLATKNSELAKENADLRKGTPATTQTPDKVELKLDHKALADKFLEKPEEAVQDIVQAVKQTITKEMTADQQRKAQEDAKEAQAKEVKAAQELLNRELGEALKDPAKEKIFRGLFFASDAESHIERTKQAIADFKQAVSIQQTKTETEQLKSSAALPQGSNVHGGKKIWKRSEIDNMIVNSPAKYAAMQDEMIAAERERRVREDL